MQVSALVNEFGDDNIARALAVLEWLIDARQQVENLQKKLRNYETIN